MVMIQPAPFSWLVTLYIRYRGLGRLTTVIWPQISGEPERHTFWLDTN